MENRAYIHFLIGELETYVLDNKSKVERIITEKKEISIQDGVFIFDKLSSSLDKTKDLIKLSREVDDKDTLRTISIISSETIAWVMFTFPSVEQSIPPFFENFVINNQHIIDALGELLIEFDEFIETPEKLKLANTEIFRAINDVSMTLGYISQMIKKGAVEN